MNVLSANITSGNMGQNLRNDLEWRDRWIARLRECEEWYANYMKAIPPCYLVYSTDIKQGELNYQSRTVPLSITARVAVEPVLQWYAIPAEVVKTVREGLLATGRAKTWGLDTWADTGPLYVPNSFIDRVYGFTAVFEIVNDKGKIIGRQERGFPYGALYNYVDGNKVNAAEPIFTYDTDIIFPAVDPYGISDALSVRISSLDGQSAAQAAGQKNISIVTEAEYYRISKTAAAVSVSVWAFNLYVRDFKYGREEGFWEYYKGAIAVIPYGVTSIEDGAFSFKGYSGRGTLTGVAIPSSVTSIGARAFDSNPLTSITIGANIGDVNGDVFPNGFDGFYIDNGRKAGTYTYNGREWSFKPR